MLITRTLASLFACAVLFNAQDSSAEPLPLEQPLWEGALSYLDAFRLYRAERPRKDGSLGESFYLDAVTIDSLLVEHWRQREGSWRQTLRFCEADLVWIYYDPGGKKRIIDNSQFRMVLLGAPFRHFEYPETGWLDGVSYALLTEPVDPETELNAELVEKWFAEMRSSDRRWTNWKLSTEMRRSDFATAVLAKSSTTHGFSAAENRWVSELLIPGDDFTEVTLRDRIRWSCDAEGRNVRIENAIVVPGDPKEMAFTVVFAPSTHVSRLPEAEWFTVHHTRDDVYTTYTLLAAQPFDATSKQWVRELEAAIDADPCARHSVLERIFPAQWLAI